MKTTLTMTCFFSIALGLISGSFPANAVGTITLAQANGATPAPSAVASPKSAKVITEDEAKKLALKAVPGKVIDIAIEKKKGANRYVVEVVPEKGGKEVDVIIHMTTGKVLSIEN
jgi:uncharacterized membrane protein YkoI